MPQNLPYRPCVGIALFNDKGEVFVGERLDNLGSWQMPQGGIDEGEDVLTAFFREMREEIGTDKAEILKISDKALRYDLPPELQSRFWGGRFAGQEQFWVAAKFVGNESDINITAHEPVEFAQWRWISFSEILDFIVPFKKETYIKVIEEFYEFSELNS